MAGRAGDLCATVGSVPFPHFQMDGTSLSGGVSLTICGLFDLQPCVVTMA